MRLAVFDCYTDEPSALGVPPYLAPLPRYVYGSVLDAGGEPTYCTVDDWRTDNRRWKDALAADILVLVGGAVVPGKYLRTMPASPKEVAHVIREFRGVRLLGGALARFGLVGSEDAIAVKGDVDAAVHDLLVRGEWRNRSRTLQEWRRWAVRGAHLISSLPTEPGLITEVDTYRGCVRYMVGGCSFCIEPLSGRPVFRPVEDILAEVRALRASGVVNFRVGGQSCIISYMCEGVGRSETPRPDPRPLRALFEGLAGLQPRVLHVDNANPAVIAEHPERSRRILETLVRCCTAGNVLALGMESADPVVIRRNGLNATPEQTMRAIEMINDVGASRGATGMPALLPGVNILAGLEGERPETFRHNLEFLRGVLRRGLLLRRINIRQVASVRRRFPGTDRRAFIRFKNTVRRVVDHPMLTRLVPVGTVLRDLLTEVRLGSSTYARQVGSYPLLVCIPYETPLGRFTDAVVVAHGERSVTALEHPVKVNTLPGRALAHLPGIGKRRAARLLRARPFSDLSQVSSAVGDASVVSAFGGWLSFEREGESGQRGCMM